MVFHSPNFLIFFLVLLLPYFWFRRARVYLLAVANILFYAASGIGILVVFMAVTVVVFATVHGMRRRGLSWMFWPGLIVTLGNLVFFKYTLFLLRTVESVSGLSLAAADSWAMSIILPIGISFYTFQLIAYMIDVRRGELTPTPSLIKFWVFISLFPQLVAGPIMRGSELMPEVDTLAEKRVSWAEIKYGVYLFFLGLVKKVLFADPLSHYVNPLFAKGTELTPMEAWQAVYAFGFQIYFDFSAYSDMALGLGFIMGIRLAINFKSPYISASPSEFWNRWHITLSHWIRDYIYIGLGGNRRKPLRVHVNLMAAMVLSGLWHGAMWTFVLWGAVHGALLIVHKWTLKLNRWAWIKRLRAAWGYRVLAVAVFFHIVTWTWVFFRAQDFGLALWMTRRMLEADPVQMLTSPVLWWVAALYGVHLLEYVIRRFEGQASRVWHGIPFPLRGAIYAGLVFAVLYFMKGETYDFIYFQF